MQTAVELIRVPKPQGHSITTMLAEAFFDDPMFRYIIPDDNERRRVLPRIFQLNLAYACRFGEVYATPQDAGAALWIPPGFAEITPWRMLQVGMFAAPFQINWRTLSKLMAVTEVMERMHKRMAPERHWYLSQIGVAPARQRQGMGGQLLAPMLARIDAAHLPCYLETTKAENVRLYERFGFVVVEEQASVRGGPGVWAMICPGSPARGKSPAHEK